MQVNEVTLGDGPADGGFRLLVRAITYTWWPIECGVGVSPAAAYANSPASGRRTERVPRVTLDRLGLGEHGPCGSERRSFSSVRPRGERLFPADVANSAVAAGAVSLAAWLAILAAPTIGALAGPRDDFFRARVYLALMLALSYAVLGLTDFTLGYDLQTTLFAFVVAAAAGSLSKRSSRQSFKIGTV